MGGGRERDPVAAFACNLAHLPVDVPDLKTPPVDEGAGVTGIPQDLARASLGERTPDELPLVGAGVEAPREPEPLLPPVPDGRVRGAGPGERREEKPAALANLRVGVGDRPASRVADKSCWQAHLELGTPRLVEDASPQAGTEHVQLGLGHRALEPEDEAVVEQIGVIDAVLVEDQGARQRADLQEPVPVGVVACQSGDLDAHHDPRLAHPDLGDEVLEAFTVGGRGGGLPLVPVDGDDAFQGPPHRHGAITQRVLPLAALRVLDHLAKGRLPHAEVGVPTQMLTEDLAVRG